MAIEGVKITVYVNDMGRSSAFYRDVLGLPLKNFPITADLSQEHWVEFDAGGTTVALHSGGCNLEERRRAINLNLVVDELEKTRFELNGRGADFGEIENPHPGVCFCHTSDPDGFKIFLNKA